MFNIYQITNTVNGKSYIGFTSKEIQERWSWHKYRSKQENHISILYQAIRKYGCDSFQIQVLEEGWDPQIGLKIREPYWISVLKPEYNMTSGGDGILGYTFSEESNLNKSIRQRGSKHKHPRTSEQNFSNYLRNIGNCKGEPQPKATCPFCHKIGGKGAMCRWHFNNCKESSLATFPL